VCSSSRAPSQHELCWGTCGKHVGIPSVRRPNGRRPLNDTCSLCDAGLFWYGINIPRWLDQQGLLLGKWILLLFLASFLFVMSQQTRAQTTHLSYQAHSHLAGRFFAASTKGIHKESIRFHCTYPANSLCRRPHLIVFLYQNLLKLPLLAFVSPLCSDCMTLVASEL
jgi:hypothetical protein